MDTSWTEGRVKELHREALQEAERVAGGSRLGRAEPPQQTDLNAGDAIQQQALQMLALAQRTAEDHVASAHSQAEKIQADARVTAEQIVRDARAQADAVRREADKALSDARAGAAQIAENARAHADDARRDSDRIVADARAQAAKMARDAQASAERLKRQAHLRYEEMVGNLEAQREALQRQIKALQEFDREYRARLLTFMQSQLRALWVDEPRGDAELDQQGPEGSAPVSPARAPDSEDASGSSPQPSPSARG